MGEIDIVRALRFTAIVITVAVFTMFMMGLIELFNPPKESDYSYECTVDRVEGTFLSRRFNLKTKRRMITMYRYTNGVERTFMFPAERVQCAERVDG